MAREKVLLPSRTCPPKMCCSNQSQAKFKTCLKLSLTPAPNARSAIAYYVSASLLAGYHPQAQKDPG